MKRIITSLLLIVFAGVMAQEHKLTVKVNGIKNLKGTLKIALYDTEDNFLKKPLVTQSVIVDEKNEAVVFDKLKAGEYAVSFFQDENNNKILDKGTFGIPTEPYGFSNNAKGFMGPPKYKQAKIIIKQNTEINITIN